MAENSSFNQNDTANEGRRMKQLSKALEKTVEKCISSGKISLFAANLEKLAQSKTESFREIHAQYQQHLRESIKEEVETLFNEEMIAALMNELDDIEDSADNDAPKWRPSGDPEKDTCAHMLTPQLKKKEKLLSILQELQEENKHIEEALLTRRAHLSKTVASVNEQVSALEQICS